MIFNRNKRDKTTSNQTSNRQVGVFTYRSNRSVNNSSIGRNRQVYKEKSSLDDSKPWWYNLPTYLAVIIVVASIIYSTILNANPKIEIAPGTNHFFLQPTNVYQKGASEVLHQSFLNGNKLTINTDKVASQIEKMFPELSGVTVVTPLIDHQPIVEIQPAQATLVLSNHQGQFVIDNEGRAIIKITQASISKINLPVVVDQSGLTVNLGEQVLPTSTISFINTVVYQFNAKNISTKSLTLVDVPYELDVQLKNQPYFIKFSLLGNPLIEVGTYLSAIKQINPIPSQYIDVRVDGKAFYQ